MNVLKVFKHVVLTLKPCRDFTLTLESFKLDTYWLTS